MGPTEMIVIRISVGVAQTAGDTRVLWQVVVTLLSSSALAALVAWILAGLKGGAEVRRQGYAAAVETMVAWTEYPFRIRRRTSDAEAIISELAGLGHDIQENLAKRRGWVAAENAVLRDVFETCLEELTAAVGPACVVAWNQPPIRTASEMNLKEFGPRGVSTVVGRMTCSVRYRFGFRRLIPDWLLRRRLLATGCLPSEP
jgi:hypothetical protein